MKLYDKLVDKAESLALVGLGYVGMPIAHAFAKKGLNVIGFDLNAAKIELYKSGIDPTMEVGDEEIKNTKIQFTADETELKKLISAVTDKYNRVPNDGYLKWNDGDHKDDKTFCKNIGRDLGDTIPYKG